MSIFDENEIDLGPTQKKLYRGAYKYVKKDNIYTEETFEVYKDKKELTLKFISELLCRLSTGELLKISITYLVGKDFVPQAVTIRKDLGKEMAEENFKLDNKKNLLTYSFKNKGSVEKREMSTPPRFSIMTPSAATSMLFFLSKKFDSTSKNFYTTINTYNQWEFTDELVVKNLALEKLSLTSETISIGGHDLQAIQYKVYENIKQESTKEKTVPPFIKVYLSRYHAIPYSILSPDGTLIQIKYFNNLDG